MYPLPNALPTKARTQLSRRQFATTVSLGLIAAPHLLLAQSRPTPPAAGGIALDYNGPPSGLDEVVLFPFDDYAIPFRYQLQMGLVPSKSHADPHTRVLQKGGAGSVDAHNISFYGTIIKVGDELRMWYI